MNLNRPRNRHSLLQRGNVLVIGLVCGGLLPMLPTMAQDDNEILPTQLFVPAPRELVRPLLRARRAIGDRDYRQAVELLGEILSSPSQVDYLQPLSDDRFRAVSIHNQAHRLLGSIPRVHRKDYELRFGITARQMLDQSVQTGDYGLMAQVSRHYFFTDAGYQATMLLGHHYLETGKPVSAISSFSSLVADSHARQVYDPEVSVLLATCWMLTGNTGQAQQVLDQLSHRKPGVRIQFLDRQVTLFSQPEDAIPWLVDLAGSSALAGYRPVKDWLMFRGDAARNAASGTGFPLRYPRWFVPTINEPRHEQLARNLFQTRSTNDRHLVPGLHPLVIDDTVVVRSLDRMIGIDFTTGKRVWEFPAWHPGSLLEEDHQSEKYRQEQIRSWHVEQRMWQDHLFGQFSSNGRHVFVIDQPGFATSTEERAVIGRGRERHSPLGGRITNELKAVDLVRQGAFCWEVGGRTGGSVPELAGCFFLGAALPLDDELYVLGEIGGEIRLIVLEQETGQLIWSQQIAAIDATLPVTQDRVRRLAGATPSFSNGILVCPTSATGIVAIERSTRSLLWGVQYPGLADIDMSSSARARRRIQIRMRGQETIETQSIDGSVTVADGCVVVMPVENDRILCYDLLTGRSLWHESTSDSGSREFGRPLDDGLYIGCVHGGQVVVVGQHKVRSLDLQSGKTLWTTLLARQGRPSGRGFQVNDNYYLPTDESKIVEIDISRGGINRTVNTQRVLGNLVCHRGDIVSQGVDVVSVYRQAEPVRDYVNQMLEQQSEENLATDVFVWQAQLQAQDGDLIAAVSTADKAYQKSGKRGEKSLLMNLILELMEQDYEHAKPYLGRYDEELASFKPLEFVAARFGGLVQEGDYSKALSLLINPGFGVFHGKASQKQYRSVEGGAVRVRLDSWLRNTLVQSIESTAADSVEAIVADWCDVNADEMSTETLDAFAGIAGLRNLPARELIRLANWHIDQNRSLAAEQILDAIRVHESSDTRAMAMAVRCKLLIRAGWTVQAARQAMELEANFSGKEILNPWTGKPASTTGIVNELLGDDLSSIKQPDWQSWKYGGVESSLEKNVSRNRRPGLRFLIYPRLVASSGIAPDNLKVEVDIHASQLIIRDSMGEELGRVNFKPESESRRYYSSRESTGKYALHGHLLIFSYGSDLAAIDLHQLRSRRNALLWHTDLHRFSGEPGQIQVSPRYSPRHVNHPWGRSRMLSFSQDETLVSNFASNSQYVFYRLGNALHAVDALTGEPVWTRSSLPDDGWLVADEDAVALLVRSDRKAEPGRYQSAIVMDAGSGRMIKSVDLSTNGKQILWHNMGLQLVFTSYDSREQTLDYVDLQGERATWSRVWPKNSLGCFRDPDTMVIVSPTGEMEYLDMQTGRTDLKSQLESGRFRTLETMRVLGHDLVFLNQDSQSGSERSSQYNLMIRAMSPLEPLFNGSIYSVDRGKGKLAWDHPVRVEHFSIPRDQPCDLPVLTLKRHIASDVTSNRNTVELYTIDLRDGRLANHDRIQGMFHAFDFSASVSEQNVVYDFGDRKLVLEFHDRELPPTAPATLTKRFTLPRVGDYSGSNSNLDSRQQLQQQLIKGARERNQDE